MRISHRDFIKTSNIGISRSRLFEIKMRNTATISPSITLLRISDLLNVFINSHFSRRERIERHVSGYLHDFSQKKRPRESFEIGTAAIIG